MGIGPASGEMKMSNPYAKSWDYTVKIKDLLLRDDELDAEQIAQIAGEVSARLTALQSRVSGHLLKAELSAVLGLLATIDASDDQKDAERTFNYALAMLYDIGDKGKRLWID